MTRVIDFFYKHRAEFGVLSILAILCIIIWGIPGKGLLYFGDVQASYIFNPERVFGSLNIWQDLYNSGLANMWIFQNYIFSFFVILSYKIFGLNLHSYLYSFLGFYLFSVSFFFLFKKILNDSLAAFFIAIFVLLSPITYTYNSSVLLTYSLAFITFALHFLHQMFFSKEVNNIKWKEIILASIFMTLANTYVQNFFLFVYIFPFFVLFNWNYIYKNKIYLLKNFSLFILFYLALNFFWIYILIHQFFNNAGNYIAAAMQSTSGLDVANLITKLSNLVDFFRVMPYHFSSGGDPLTLYNTNYFLLISSYLVAIIAFSSLIFIKDKKIKKNLLFSLLLFIITFPILNGNKPPFEKIFLFFWENIPLAKTFRTFTKLMFINLYAVAYLLGVSINYLLSFKKYKLCLSIGLFILVSFPIIIYFRPILRNRVFLQDNVPAYYEEIRKEFNQPLLANTMMIPQTNWLVSYKWRTREKDTENIFPFFYNGRVFTNGASYEHSQEWQNYNNLVASYIINQYFDSLGYLFSFKNVGFVALQDDIDSFLDFNEGARITTESNIKGNGIFFKEIAKFGSLYIYETPDEYFNQQIFSPQKIKIVKRNSSSENVLYRHSPFIVSGLLNKEKSIDLGIIFEEQNKTKFGYPVYENEELFLNYKKSVLLDKSSPNDSPKIQSVNINTLGSTQGSSYENINVSTTKLNKANVEFKKSSPQQYEVVIHNAKPNDVPIQFSETYDKGWKVYAADEYTHSDDASIDCAKTKNICPSRQAEKESIIKFVEENKISVLGGNYISKEFSGSIQNNNLINTPFYKLLNRRSIDADHYLSNGYSNLFVINPQDICKRNPFSCKINSDGTHDVHLVIFLEPQKYFYFAFLFTSSFLLGCIIYLIIIFIKKNKYNQLH